MNNTFDFENLFTLEMANNHQGSVEHGKKIIRAMGELVSEFNLKASVKLQFRDLNTFIHPHYRDRQDVKHIPRFISTELKKEDFKELVAEVKANGMYSMATPFDEASVALIKELDIDIVKVASCSALDWPLLEAVAQAGKPTIISVGGLSLPEVDRVVSFFEHKGVNFAIMHCVAVYPTPAEAMFLKQIDIFKKRYPKHTIGFSTHETPDNTAMIGLAYAKGARIFEKHVGVATDTISLNAYSANPEQTKAWVEAYVIAKNACGEEQKERPISDAERTDLKSLARGVFLKNPVTKGTPLYRSDVYFAMPLVSESAMKSGEWREGLIANRDYVDNSPLDRYIAEKNEFDKREVVYKAVREVKAMLNEANLHLSHEFTVEISHHYGLEKFHEVGCFIIDCFNRAYAKKLIIQLPGQSHPTHYHKKKDETFQVLFGSAEFEIEGKKKLLNPGDVVWLPQGVWHSFYTENGVIFEEISTTALETQGDSYYVDRAISEMPREQRKTKLLNWGRYQFD
jgi:sialic acid synthase SpsE/mannose-6-phosphate isomerase-like protein (cupin superfamily)